MSRNDGWSRQSRDLKAMFKKLKVFCSHGKTLEVFALRNDITKDMAYEDWRKGTNCERT